MLTDFKESLEQMNLAFKSDAKSVKDCSENLYIVLSELKDKSLKGELKQHNKYKSTIELIEKLSIINEYKLNLFKDFYSYYTQKK